MSEKQDSKPDNFPEYRTQNRAVGIQKMTIVVEMQRDIKRLAGPRRSGDNQTSMIARAANKAGISFRQAKAFFYGESDNPGGKAVDAVRAAAAKQKQTEQAASDELTELRTRIARLERLLDAKTANKDRQGDHQAR